MVVDFHVQSVCRRWSLGNRGLGERRVGLGLGLGASAVRRFPNDLSANRSPALSTGSSPLQRALAHSPTYPLLPFALLNVRSLYSSSLRYSDRPMNCDVRAPFGFLPTAAGQTEISRPLGTVTFDMLVLALGEEGDWLKVYSIQRNIQILFW